MSKLMTLSLTDDFLFNLFVQENGNEELLKEIIERFLGIKIAEIRLREKQHAIITDPAYHGSRLDAFVRDINGNIYNIEVQNMDLKDLEMRMRFYQSLIDKESMPSGEYDYNKLPKTVIIFVCNFDYFKKGLFRYTFRNCCMEDKTLFLNDGTFKVVLNTKGTDPSGVSEETVNLLKYFSSSFTSTAEKLNDPFVKKLDKLVTAIKKNSKYEGDLMRYEERIYRERKESKEEGIEIGIGIGEVKATIELCYEFGQSDDEVAERLKKKFLVGDEKARSYITQYKPRV